MCNDCMPVLQAKREEKDLPCPCGCMGAKETHENSASGRIETKARNPQAEINTKG